MAVTYQVTEGVLVDRHYRGAIVMVGASCYALAEPFVSLIEYVRQHPRAPLTAENQDLAAALAELGVLASV